MARLQFYSGTPDVSIDVVVPEYFLTPSNTTKSYQEFYQTRQEIPVLWLLHKEGGDSSDWMRYTPIESFAQETGLSVGCPSGGQVYFVEE